MENFGLYVLYCMHQMYSIFVYRMYYVHMLVLYVEEIEWQSWKQTSPGVFPPDYHRLVLPQQERVDQPDKKHPVRGSSLIIIDW